MYPVVNRFRLFNKGIRIMVAARSSEGLKQSGLKKLLDGNQSFIDFFISDVLEASSYTITQ
jgi:hypothetical protein